MLPLRLLQLLTVVVIRCGHTKAPSAAFKKHTDKSGNTLVQCGTVERDGLSRTTGAKWALAHSNANSFGNFVDPNLTTDKNTLFHRAVVHTQSPLIIRIALGS